MFYHNQTEAMKQQITLDIPKQLALICELLETTPERVLQGFINDVSLEVNSSGSDERAMAVEYFLRCGHGMHRYDFEEVQQMFDGLNGLRRQWPGNDPAAEKQYRKQCSSFLKQWYKSWKTKRTGP